MTVSTLWAKARRWAAIASLSLVTACGPNVYDEIELMPSPTLYAEADFDPLVDITAENVAERAQLFYATDRMPADPDDPQAFYNNKRGHLLRTGVANV